MIAVSTTTDLLTAMRYSAKDGALMRVILKLVPDKPTALHIGADVRATRKLVAELDHASVITVAERLIDEKLVERLIDGSLRLVSVRWLLSDGAGASERVVAGLPSCLFLFRRRDCGCR